MRFLLLIIVFCSLSYADQYAFLVDRYDKEIELEAKILSKVATASLGKQIKLFIPKISDVERKVYSHFFTLVEDCENSNFIFINKTTDEKKLCKKSNKLFFTNNYQKLLSDTKFYGAFFWSKSRPNIVFVKDRLAKNNIRLPQEYERYIEDFDGH